MPVIDIKEIDSTIITDVAAITNNVVFVPGTAITGPTEPTLCTTYEQFINTFGNRAPSTGSYGNTWEYAANMIIAGFPVLFQRIVNTDTDNEEESKSATAAQYIFSKQPVEEVIIDTTTISSSNAELTDIAIQQDTLEELTGTPLVLLQEDAPDYELVYMDKTPEPTEQDPDPEPVVGWYMTISDTDIDVSAAVSVQGEPVVNDTITFRTTLNSDGEEIPLAIVRAKYEGSFGNNLRVAVITTSAFVYLQVYEGDSMEVIETIRICAKDNESIENTFNNFKQAVRDNDGIHTSYVIYDITEDLTYVEFQNGIYTDSSKPDTTKIWQLADGTDITDEDIIQPMADLKFDIFDTTGPLSDKFVYDISFITLGGLNLPRIEATGVDNIYERMTALAQYRGDCLAVLDPPYSTDPNDVVTEQDETYFNTLLDNVNSSYATAFSPWMYMSLDTNAKAKWMAPSYAFLHQLARSVQGGNPIWQTPAGVQRGSIAEAIKPAFEIGSAILDTWQNTGVQFVNPIMKLRQYGYVLFGNRTLYKYPEGQLGSHSALQELGVRMTAIEIKKAILNVAISLTFQPNTYLTWLAFKSGLEPTLAEMKVQGGLIDYEIIMDETTTTTEDIANNTVNGIVRVNIARAAENFKIAFELSAAGVTFGSEL